MAKQKTKYNTKNDLTDQQISLLKNKMLAALEFHLGIVSNALSSVSITKAMHDNWYKDDTEYRERVDNILELALDFVEGKLLKKIKQDNLAAIKFYLSKKGASRGYGDDLEIFKQQAESAGLMSWTIVPVKSEKVETKQIDK